MFACSVTNPMTLGADGVYGAAVSVTARLFTVTITDADVVTLPAVSRAIAVSV